MEAHNIALITATSAAFATGAFWLYQQYQGDLGDLRRAETMRTLLESLAKHDDGLTPVMRTACTGAGMRAAECDLIPGPLIDDPVAKLLAGSRGYRTGRMWMELVLEQEGAGRHSQVAARARILDDAVYDALAGLAVQQPNAPVLQVVCLGCGMDTRPWRMRRMPGGPRVVWFEVDQKPIIELKKKLLKDAGVEVVPPPPPKSPRRSPFSSPAKHQKQLQQQQQQAPPPAQPWPYPALAVDQLSSVVCDLSDAKAALPAALKSAGFSPSIPTVWVLEGLVYYLELEAVKLLLATCATLSTPGSRLAVTMVCKECLEANHSVVEATPSLSWFAFHNCFEELQGGEVMQALGWGGVAVSPDLAEVAKIRYGVHCYPFYPRFFNPVLGGLRDVEHVLTARCL